ncbi:glycerophosphodiester phosphodiesterase [Mycolicibacterium sp. P9-64]|uniref:glycerophosphodiester phosphodiesterase n=1 Tax=Mycolicibacterium sp. P9-64 TaxID=2024612 RepID=UPI001F5BDA0B|nr:glycerophosphodiester phosphodiesterase [Mycolicibacterium sp. P9-64]
MALLASATVLGVVGPVPSAAPAAPGAFDLQAHRGGRGETTEESLRAFSKALELGVSTLEFDIVLTKDNQPLVWHDPTVDPTKCVDTGPALPGDPQYPYVGKLVHDLTFAQIRTLDCGKLLSDFPNAEVVRHNKIATLPEVFELADSYRADVRYNIETKIEADKPGNSATPAEFVDTILPAIRAAGKIDKVEIQSFDWRSLPLVRQAEPSIPLVALWDDTTWVPDSPWLAGVNPASWASEATGNAVVGDPIAGATMVGANILSPGYSVPTGLTPKDPNFALVADKAFIDRAHALGLQVIPWTINDADVMRAQIAAGADGIITDYPTRLRNVMAGLGMPLPPAYHRVS